MDGLRLTATAKVKLTKTDEVGNIVSIEEHEVKLTDEEAKALWLLQQQD